MYVRVNDEHSSMCIRSLRTANSENEREREWEFNIFCGR